MRNDATEYVRKCEQCQKHAHLIHQPAGHLNPISSSWPFAQWGLDILGPFPRAIGNRRFILVVVDYFTKWAEAEALANIRDVDVKNFVWKNIITRFGVPNTLISDNGLQFDSRAFHDFYRDLGITNWYPTPAHPQSNGQVFNTIHIFVHIRQHRFASLATKIPVSLPGALLNVPIHGRHTLLHVTQPTVHLLFQGEGIKGMVLRRTFDKASYLLTTSTVRLLDRPC